jgi:serine-type D-Ala-D-Ala carboxypeptidase/endopeptidase (penicillin-binding protein 4)
VKRFFCVLLVMVFVGGLTVAPQAEVSEKARRKIADKISEALEHQDFKNALVGILVEEADSGEVVYEKNAHITMIPASNNKLFTTAAALEILGDDYSYKTGLYRIGDIEDGILKGHLVVAGSGDPTISGRYNEGDITATLKKWVDVLKKAGVRRVEGYLVGDDDIWNDDDYVSGWGFASVGEWYSAPSSALSFNDNCVDITWSPGAKSGAPATYTLEPETDYLTFINRVTTRPQNSGSDRYYRRRMYSSTVEVVGGIDINRSRATDYASVDNPTLYFVTVLSEIMEREGIEVLLGPIDIDEFKDKEFIRKGRVELTHHISPPLWELCRVINKRSQNFYAEQVLRTLGKEQGGDGGYRSGARAVRDFLVEKGVPTGGFRMSDGSGLAWTNHTSPRTLVELLRVMKDNVIYVDSLPVGGERGSLQSRFVETNTMKRVRSRVKGKTGLINMTRTLSGYVETDSGQQLAYSVMLNNYTGGRSTTWIDRIVTTIATEGEGWE